MQYLDSIPVAVTGITLIALCLAAGVLSLIGWRESVKECREMEKNNP